MKRTVFAKFEVEDNVNNGFVVNTLEKQALKMTHCDLEEAVCAESDSDNKHERYINYLINWAIDHNDEAYEGCSPAGFDEWLETEDYDYEDVPDWRVSEGEYEITDDGDIILGKEAAFNFKIGDYKRIEFLDDFGDTERIGTYRVIDNDGCKVTCEKLA